MASVSTILIAHTVVTALIAAGITIFVWERNRRFMGLKPVTEAEVSAYTDRMIAEFGAAAYNTVCTQEFEALCRGDLRDQIVLNLVRKEFWRRHKAGEDVGAGQTTAASPVSPTHLPQGNRGTLH